MKEFPPKVCLTPPEISRRLEESGIQPTVHRIAIGQYVLCEADHPTVEVVHKWTEKNLAKISLATVYNTLRSLVDAGLLKEFVFTNTGKVIFDSNTEPHHHFYDEAANRLYDIPLDSVDVKPRLGKGFEIDRTDIVFTGRIKKSK